MARFDSGYIKWYRTIDDSWIGKDGYARAIWSWILEKVNWQESKIRFNGKIVKLKPGSMVTSASEIAANIGFTRRVVEERLKLLEDDKTIDQIHSNNGRVGRIITIRNYKKWNPDKHSAEHEESTASDTERSTVSSTLNEELRIKKEEIKDISPENFENPEPVIEAEYVSEETKPATRRQATAKITEGDILLAEKWAAHTQGIQTWAKIDLAKFEEGISHVRRNIGLTDEEMAALFEWIRKDSFWHNKALSPKNLMNRTKKDGPRKIDYILQGFKEQWDKARAFQEWVTDDSDEIDYTKYAPEVKI
jgi:hypothetical protein